MATDPIFEPVLRWTEHVPTTPEPIERPPSRLELEDAVRARAADAMPGCAGGSGRC